MQLWGAEDALVKILADHHKHLLCFWPEGGVSSWAPLVRKKGEGFKIELKLKLGEKIFCLFRVKAGSGACSCRHVQCHRSCEESVSLPEKWALCVVWQVLTSLLKTCTLLGSFPAQAVMYLAVRNRHLSELHWTYRKYLNFYCKNLSTVHVNWLHRSLWQNISTLSFYSKVKVCFLAPGLPVAVQGGICLLWLSCCSYVRNVLRTVNIICISSSSTEDLSGCTNTSRAVSFAILSYQLLS